MENKPYSPPSELRAAIRSISEETWIEFFNSLRQDTYNKIRATDDGALVGLKLEIKVLDLLQQKFVEMMKKTT